MAVIFRFESFLESVLFIFSGCSSGGGGGKVWRRGWKEGKGRKG